MSSAGSRILDRTREIEQLGPRLPSSKAEEECHRLVAKTLERLGIGSVWTEEFKFLNWVPLSQRLTRGNEEIPVQQLGYSPPGDIEAKLRSCGGGSRDECLDTAGRIAVCSSGWEDSLRFLHRIEKYRNAVMAGAVGFILVGDAGHSAPLGIIRKRRLGQIPAIAVTYETAREYMDFGRASEPFHLSVRCQTHPSLSRNTVWCCEDKKPGIVLCSHCDSWDKGAWDNASGVATLLELAPRLTAHELKHEVTLCFTGAEEFGLFGSSEFCSKHPSEFAFAVNVDGVGLHGAELQARCGDRNLARIPPLRGIFSELPLTPWGDHYSFHRAGIRTIFLTSGGTSPIQHSGEDRAERLNADELEASLAVLFNIVTYLDSVL